MKKVKVDKLECHYPALFKVLWGASVVWLLVGIVNYFGHWLVPSKLDGFGMIILSLFAVSVFICFWKGLLKLVSKHGILAIDNITRKVASYSFLVSFIVGDIIKAVIVSIAAVIIYWYVIMFFVLFYGRIRRIGIEVVIAITILVFLSININNSIWQNAFVVLIATAFLYDIWCIADFQETHFSMSQLESLVTEDDTTDKEEQERYDE